MRMLGHKTSETAALSTTTYEFCLSRGWNVQSLSLQSQFLWNIILTCSDNESCVCGSWYIINISARKFVAP